MALRDLDFAELDRMWDQAKTEGAADAAAAQPAADAAQTAADAAKEIAR